MQIQYNHSVWIATHYGPSRILHKEKLHKCSVCKHFGAKGWACMQLNSANHCFSIEQEVTVIRFYTRLLSLIMKNNFICRKSLVRDGSKLKAQNVSHLNARSCVENSSQAHTLCCKIFLQLQALQIVDLQYLALDLQLTFLHESRLSLWLIILVKKSIL
jgi:hypothetical protein